MNGLEIKLGATYSNGEFGKRWAVWQVLEIRPCDDEPELECVICKVLVGSHRRAKIACTRAEFARWARYEVVRNENVWERIDTPPPG